MNKSLLKLQRALKAVLIAGISMVAFTGTPVLAAEPVIALPQVQELSPHEKMIYRRAVEAAVWGMPIEGTRGLLLAARSSLGADWNDVIYFSKPMESRHGFLTANNQVPYGHLEQ